MTTTSNTSHHTECDVAVIGGGPAGTALATFLARNGRSCLVFEQTKFPRYHIGESLVPHTYGIFDRLGLLPKLKASSFPEKHGVRFILPDEKEATPFYFSETIPGDGARTWQVERGAFDRLMVDHARENGVEVREETGVDTVLFEDGRATGVSVTGPGGPETIGAKVVVDASGRATVLGRQLELKGEVPGLNKASLWGYFRGGRLMPGRDAGETTMHLIREGGWFWFIPLPDDMASVGIVADPEYLFAGEENPETILEREIGLCVSLAERLAEAERVGPVRGLHRLAYLNRETCGDGWVMIGDARAFLDPIYSSGLFLALGSAEMAALCIEEALQANDTSAARLGSFEPALWDGIETVRRLIHAFYDPAFSFSEFNKRYPEHRHSLIDCLVGDVVKDMTPFRKALESMTPPPPPLK